MAGMNRRLWVVEIRKGKKWLSTTAVSTRKLWLYPKKYEVESKQHCECRIIAYLPAAMTPPRKEE